MAGGSGVWAWGSGAGYKLGLGDQKDRDDPVPPEREDRPAGVCWCLAQPGNRALPSHAGRGHGATPSSLPSPDPHLRCTAGAAAITAQGPKQICHLPEPVEYFYK
jgi:hypothetical protein